jgi:hypothetical protein
MEVLQTMSVLDGIMQPIAGCPDTVTSLAQAAGLDPAVAEKAVMVLARSFVESGRTIGLIEGANGLGAGVLSAIAARIGGEASLRRIATVELTATKTGIDAARLEALVDALGGEESLGAIAAGLSNGLGELAKGDIREDLALFFPAFFKRAA